MAETTEPQAPPPVRSLGTIPDIDGMTEVEYNIACEQVSKQWPGWSDDLVALGGNVFENSKVTKAFASAASLSAIDAAQTQQVVLAAANFKGLWSDMTGALNKPATVKHSSRFWLLTRNIANVQTEVPGVSDAWTSLDSGQVVTQKITSNTQGIAGVKYLITGTALTLTAPASPNKGDRFSLAMCTAFVSQKVDFGAVKVLGKAAGVLDLNSETLAIDLQYEDATLGWIRA